MNLNEIEICVRPNHGTRGIRNTGGGVPSRKRQIDAIDSDPVDILCPPRKIKILDIDNSQTIDKYLMKKYALHLVYTLEGSTEWSGLGSLKKCTPPLVIVLHRLAN